MAKEIVVNVLYFSNGKVFDLNLNTQTRRLISKSAQD